MASLYRSVGIPNHKLLILSQSYFHGLGRPDRESVAPIETHDGCQVILSCTLASWRGRFLWTELRAVRADIVVKAEAQAEILAGKLPWKGWERVGPRNTAICRAVERHIGRRIHYLQSGNVAIF